MTDAEMIVLVLGSRDAMHERDCTPDVEAARAAIAARYRDLKRRHSYMASERMAKTEWLAAWLEGHR